MLVKMLRNWITPTLIVGTKKDMPVLENGLAAFYKPTYLITIQSNNHIFGLLTQESENLCSYKILYISIYCGFIHSDPKLGGK